MKGRKGKMNLQATAPPGRLRSRREPGRSIVCVQEMFKRFVQDERGLEVVEYSILAGLIVAGVIATIAAIGAWVAGIFSSVKTSLGA